MTTFVFAAPLLPGKEATAREMTERLAKGQDHDAYVEARSAAGATRERAWLQETPEGAMVIVVLEGEEDTLTRMSTSDLPFDQMFREYVKDVHGFDMAQSPVPRLPLLLDATF